MCKSRFAKQIAAILVDDHSAPVVQGVPAQSSALACERGPKWPVSQALSGRKTLS
jgi:hypothetical protein